MESFAQAEHDEVTTGQNLLPAESSAHTKHDGVQGTPSKEYMPMESFAQAEHDEVTTGQNLLPAESSAHTKHDGVQGTRSTMKSRPARTSCRRSLLRTPSTMEYRARRARSTCRWSLLRRRSTMKLQRVASFCI